MDRKWGHLSFKTPRQEKTVFQLFTMGVIKSVGKSHQTLIFKKKIV